jgi:serine/threonine-protein kinase
MCRGLSAVHKAGVIHGDLKPRNVMVMANGVLKLMDFGVARGVGGGPGLAAASPHYMSPEQARGGELDVRTDLYSAGVVLYEIFTGRRPFEADRPQDLASLHMFENAVSPRTLRPDLPALLEQVILSCLAKSRLQRPATAADLERALMRVHV